MSGEYPYLAGRISVKQNIREQLPLCLTTKLV